MKKHVRRWVALSATALAATTATSAQAADNSDPLINLLLKKGILSEDEAAKVQAEADAMRSNAVPVMPTESKWKIGKDIKNIELYGDLRARYENRRAEDAQEGSIELQRFRYAVRLGIRGELFDDWYFGVRLDTAANPRSPWVTFGTSSSGVPYQGPFGKSTGGINVGQIFIGYKPADWLDISVGKMANPLYTTPMVWDTDYAPEGLAEKLKHSIGAAELFANFGQFLYEDTNPNQNSSGYFNLPRTGSSPAVLLTWQAGFNYHFTKDINFKIAPVLYQYVGHGVNPGAAGAAHIPDFSGVFVGQGSTNNLAGHNAGAWSGYPNGFYDGFTANQTGINDLLVLEVPAEVNFPIWKLNARLFGDYAQNLEGSARARHAAEASLTAFQPVGGGEIAPITSAQTEDVHAYQVGLGVGSGGLVYGPAQGLVYGSTSRKHAWEVRTYWQHIEQYALDVNLIDSDFFEGRGNLEGFYASAAYSLTDNILATLRYGHAHQINDQIGTGGSNQDIPQMNPVHDYDLWQVDLTFRF